MKQETREEREEIVEGRSRGNGKVKERAKDKMPGGK